MNMKTANNNPPGNILGPGVTESLVDAAILKSGFPLQTRVSGQLRGKFNVQEEWSYIDKNTSILRNIDIVAEQDFFLEGAAGIRIRPRLNLIIECKQANLPYVFFLSNNSVMVPNFPFLAGLKYDLLKIKSDFDRSTWRLSVLDTLSLSRDNFLLHDPVLCTNFSKGERRGSDIILSGEMPFNEIVHPIMSAMDYFKRVETPPKTAHYFDLHMVIGMCVLDAPMIGVRVNDKGHDSEYIPWVRVLRHQTNTMPDLAHGLSIFAIEVIHKEYLDEYLTSYLVPFAERLAKLSIKHHHIIADGDGFVPGLDEMSLADIEKNLQQESFTDRMTR